jgi:hypothetical protein
MNNHQPSQYFDPYDDPRVRNKKKVLPLGILLIIFGILNFCASIFSSVYAKDVARGYEQQKRKFANNPAFVKAMDFQIKNQPLLNGLSAVFSSLIAIGGYQLITFSGKPFCWIAVILCLLPVNCCCCLGFCLGFWGCVILTLKDVNDAFEYQKRINL